VESKRALSATQHQVLVFFVFVADFALSQAATSLQKKEYEVWNSDEVSQLSLVCFHAPRYSFESLFVAELIRSGPESEWHYARCENATSVG
jgi:hypothetical protein